MMQPSFLYQNIIIFSLLFVLTLQLRHQQSSWLSSRDRSWQAHKLLRLFRERRSSKDLAKNKVAKDEVVLGLLIPYNVTGAADLSGYSGGEYYAAAFLLAIDDINKDKTLLPNIFLNYVWNDTMCLDDLAIRNQIWQHCSYQGKERKGVDAFIGTGCKCGTVVKNAGALNLPIISHVSMLLFFPFDFFSIFCP